MQKNGAYRELTWTAVIGGILVGAVLNMGICYAGMQIGFTIVGSTVAAVLVLYYVYDKVVGIDNVKLS